MKQISALFVLFILLFTSCNNGQASSSTGNLNWNGNLEKAIELAKKENKAVLVNFTGSDWCIWCKRLSAEVFDQKEFEEYAEKSLVLVMLDFPKDIAQTQEIKEYNNKLAQKYGIQGFPTILLINGNGQLVAQTGYQPGGAAKYVEHIKSYL
ncbi:MAG TPA: thioredoxin family protein [Ignavibacteriaceae bacterium]|nr:thioredoxin family protein [Ignavibacteriaceae bacterium]